LNLLIFGFGYTGKILASRLMAKGWDVAATVRKAEDRGAAATLGVRPVDPADPDALARAAGKALEAINSWLFSQGWSQPQRPKARADMSAILMMGRRLGFITAAARAVYLWRADRLSQLDGSAELSRCPRCTKAIGRSVQP